MALHRRTLFTTVPAGVAAAQLLTGARPVPETLYAAIEPGPTPDRLVLNPTPTPTRSVTVTWRTDARTREGVAQYRPVGGGPTRSVPAKRTLVSLPLAAMPPARHHTATMDGLEPNTTYGYRVGSAATGWSPWRRVTTASARMRPWTFLYFGDAQISLDVVWPANVRRALASYPRAALSLHAGDLINDSDQDQQWAQWFAGAGSLADERLVIASPGNHEYSGDLLLQQYRAHFGMPVNGPLLHHEDVWFTDYQGVRFISLNGNAPLGGPDQARWMRRLLTNNPMRWSVVTFHQPMFSATPDRDNRLIRNTWLPVFEELGVDLVLQGHDHTYARGHLTANEAGDGSHRGPVYVVSDAGGKWYDLDQAGRNNWTENGATRAVAYEGVTTYQAIIVHADRLVYRAHAGWFRDDPNPYGLALDDVVDSFAVVRQADGSKRVVAAG